MQSAGAFVRVVRALRSYARALRIYRTLCESCARRFFFGTRPPFTLLGAYAIGIGLCSLGERAATQRAEESCENSKLNHVIMHHVYVVVISGYMRDGRVLVLLMLLVWMHTFAGARAGRAPVPAASAAAAAYAAFDAVDVVDEFDGFALPMPENSEHLRK